MVEQGVRAAGRVSCAPAWIPLMTHHEARRPITLVRLASAEPMGQQIAEDGLIAALRARSTEMEVRIVQVAPLRSSSLAGRRIPVARIQGLPWSAQTLVGRWCYRGSGLVHSLDLGLPPSPGPEVLTIHDLAPLHFADEGQLPAWAGESGGGGGGR